MNFLLILLIILLVIFVLQFDLKVKFNYNLISNTGKLTVKLFGLTIIRYYLTFKKGCIEVISKRTQKFIPFEFTRESFDEVSKLDDFIFSKIFFKRVSIFINVGIENDAYKTAIISGFLNTFLTNLLIYLKNAKNEVLERIHIYNDFNKTNFNFSLKCKISISIIDFIWCIVENIAYKQIFKNTNNKNEQNK